MEIWKDIEGYEGLYQISNFGRVRSLNYRGTGQTKVLSPGEGGRGYLLVNLCKNGKTKKYQVHRLVAEAFIPNWFDDPQVNHIDEDKTNNRVENLEWCSAKYNINYGTHNKRVFEKTTNGKLSKPVLQFTKTGEFVREWPSISEAERNGFNNGHIASCCRGERQTHKGYVWKYKEVV